MLSRRSHGPTPGILYTHLLPSGPIPPNRNPPQRRRPLRSPGRRRLGAMAAASPTASSTHATAVSSSTGTYQFSIFGHIDLLKHARPGDFITFTSSKFRVGGYVWAIRYFFQFPIGEDIKDKDQGLFCPFLVLLSRAAPEAKMSCSPDMHGDHAGATIVGNVRHPHSPCRTQDLGLLLGVKVYPSFQR